MLNDLTKAQTGLSLRLQRVARDVKSKDLAAAMGVDPSTLSRIENRRSVNTKVATRYLVALGSFPVKDDEEAA